LRLLFFNFIVRHAPVSCPAIMVLDKYRENSCILYNFVISFRDNITSVISITLPNIALSGSRYSPKPRSPLRE
jgi:hypothetical protein